MKITITIPAYNEEKYIGKTLDSVKKLKKGDWTEEVLVIDGGSSDKTREIAKQNGVRVIHEPHKSIGFARQHGLKHAKGDIIAFTDADTILPPDWLLKHVAILEKSGVVLSLGTFKVFDGNFPYLQYINYLQAPLQWISFELLGIPVASGQNMAFWREKAIEIGGFDINLRLIEDVDFAIRMKKVGKVVFSYNMPVFSSGRRSNEGWRFFARGGGAFVKYFLGEKTLPKFPDYR